ncbi:MAG: copper homeostasis protein CutC [Gemmatimonadaceae bacterium]
MILVEAAVETLESALSADRAGVDRIELCAALNVGGTTPPQELIKAVRDRCRIPLFVMIRPRAGDFTYSQAEAEIMRMEIEAARLCGVAGIVTGALDVDQNLDLAKTQSFLDAAKGLPVTFHRAFDFAANGEAALEQLMDIGVTRILTSGGGQTALDGADRIASFVARARGRITVVAGGGVRRNNVRDLIGKTGVTELHARMLDEDDMRSLVELARSARSGVHHS